jgi:hypothetical protein
MNDDYGAKFDHEYGSISGLPGHLEEISSSSKKRLLDLTLAKRLPPRDPVAKIDSKR